MENENINGPVKAENVPAPVEASQPAEPPEAPAAEPVVTPTPADQQPPAPEPELAPASVSTPVPTAALTPAPTPSQPPALETTPSQAQSQPINLPNPPLEGGQKSILNLLLKAKEKIQFRKRAKLEKIIVLAQSKGKITNNDIEKLLRCSDATATRYLAELVKQGRLRRVGAGPALIYEFLR